MRPFTQLSMWPIPFAPKHPYAALQNIILRVASGINADCLFHPAACVSQFQIRIPKYLSFEIITAMVEGQTQIQTPPESMACRLQF